MGKIGTITSWLSSKKILSGENSKFTITLPREGGGTIKKVYNIPQAITRRQTESPILMSKILRRTDPR